MVYRDWRLIMDELMDTYDINGNFVGVNTRSFCHGKNPGVYHKPVWVFIKNDQNEILVQKRSTTKTENPGKWDMPAAGHVLAGETSLQGCVRETEEELGLKYEETDFVFLKEWVNQEGWELAQIFMLTTNAKVSEMTLQPNEVDQVKWLKYDEFVKLLYSKKFCQFPIEYKNWIAQVLK